MAQEGLADFIVHPEPLQSGGKGMAQVMKMQIVDSNPRAGFVPILLKCPRIGPMTKDPTIE